MHQIKLAFPQKKLQQVYFDDFIIMDIKDTLWVLRRGEPLVHVSVDISLNTKHIWDHDISLKR